MPNVTPFPRPIHWDGVRSDDAKRIINQWSEDDGKVIYTDHALIRMQQRGLTRAGTVLDDPKKDEHGNWVAIVEGEISGGRDAGVVTAILNENQELVIITVQWMDLK